MTVPEVLLALKKGLLCQNCVLYNWEQCPDVVSSLTRCSGCKTLHYCSKECQEEHWAKVHKYQCKYLVPKPQPFCFVSKELVGKIDYQHIDMDLHDPRWCQMCKDEDKDQVIKPDNPSYGCHVRYSMAEWEEGPCTIPWGSKDLNEDIRTKLPFDIYKIEDLRSGSEKVVWLLQALLYKMKVTKFPFAKAKDRKAVMDLRNILQHTRLKTWLVYMTVPSKASNHVEYEVSQTTVNVLGNSRYLNVMTDVKVRPGSEDKFGLWDIFKLLSEFILSSDVATLELASLGQLGLEDFPAEYRTVVEAARNSGSLAIRDSIVAALSTNLIPFMRVVELLCGGLEQQCTNCKDQITIGAVYYPVEDKKIPSQPFVTSGIIKKFSCTKKSCVKIILENRLKEFRILNSLTRAVRAKYAGNVCDFCFMAGKKAHRCGGCKTKVYCSQTCLEEDWAGVHKKICARSKGELRKVKEGKRGRKEESGRQLEAWVDCHKEAFGEDSVMDKVVKKLDKL